MHRSMLHRSILCSFAVIAVTLIADPAFAQRDTSIPGTTIEIQGQVRMGSGEALAQNVLVKLESFGRGMVDQTFTDSRGQFRFSRLNPGEYTVIAESPGFKGDPERVELDGRFRRRAQVFLQLIPEKSNAPRNTSGSNVLDVRIPDDARKEFEKGRAALMDKKDKVDEGISHLEKAVSLYPKFSMAHFFLGTAYMDKQLWEKAVEALRRAADADPKMTDALVYMGESYRRQKLYTESEKVLLEALQLDNKSWRAHFTLARVYWEMGNPDKARIEVVAALKLKPDLAEGHLLAGNIFIRASMAANALVEYEEYLRLSPKGELSEQVRALVQKMKQAIPARK